MLLLTPGAPARIQFAVPAPTGMDQTKMYRLCAQLYVMDARGTVVAVAPVPFDVAGSVAAGSPVVVTAQVSEDEATRAAVALAGRDGRWDLVLCYQGNCPQGAMSLETGPAHSTVDNRSRIRVPVGCRDCGKTAGPVLPPPPGDSATKGKGKPHGKVI